LSSRALKMCRLAVASAVSAGRLPRAFSGFEEKLCEGAVRGLDVNQFKDLGEWLSWLSWASVVLDRDDYLRAAVHALHQAPKLSRTDYGTARQRDLGQLWTDTIRGLLGEIAFAKWLYERFGRVAELDFRLGPLKEFLPSDIRSIDGRPPKLKVSIKSTKLEGIWLDVPGKQIEHSDIFVLVRLGVTREHFLAFLKEISAIRDKLLEEALKKRLVTEEELREAWNAIPQFTPIPAYIVGFLDKAEIADCVRNELCIIEADGEVKAGRVVIRKYLGFRHPGKPEYDEALRRALKSVGRSVENKRIEFEGIGDFTKQLHFIANSGFLRRKGEEWESLISRL
jgi:hypothetical protein